MDSGLVEVQAEVLTLITNVGLHEYAALGITSFFSFEKGAMSGVLEHSVLGVLGCSGMGLGVR